MFCTKCGSELPEGTQFCPKCGAPASLDAKFQRFKDVASNTLNDAENQLGGAINDITGNSNGPTGGRLQTDRSLVMYILLSIITCGIYGYYFIYKMARDVNVACDGDGESTTGLIGFIVLCFITCSIYSWFWYYKLGNRLQANAPRYGMSFEENGTTLLLWLILGWFVCGLGVFVAMHILIKNSNALCTAWNAQHGF